MSTGNMSANQIMDDIKKSHSIGISSWTTLQAKHRALDVLEGDAAKQYSL